MTTGDAGRALIQSFESCRLAAYPDPKTGGVPWTCGWGSTGPDIGPGTVWTQQQADDRFAQSLSTYEAVVNEVTHPLNQNMFDACVSLAYNIGVGRFRGSTLMSYLNQGLLAEAANEFPKWDSPGSNVQAGLDRRRAAERALFLTPWG